MESRYLNADQMAQLQSMMDQDAANPAPPEAAPEMEEAAAADEVDTVNETVEDMSEGNGEAQDPAVVPDPNAGGNPQTAAIELPDGFTDVNQLIAAYGTLKAQNAEIEGLRDLNSQLVAIAEALGYTKDIGSVPLEFDENDPRAEVHKLLGPMIEQQQKNIRQRMIDSEWKRYAGEHRDIEDLMEDIGAIMKEDPGLSDSERGLEIAHQLAMAKRYRPEKALFEDEAFIEKAAGNKRIQDRVIEEYLKKVAKGGEEAAVSVGGGGNIASSGKKKQPATLQDAKRGLLRLLGE